MIDQKLIAKPGRTANSDSPHIDMIDRNKTKAYSKFPRFIDAFRLFQLYQNNNVQSSQFLYWYEKNSVVMVIQWRRQYRN